MKPHLVCALQEVRLCEKTPGVSERASDQEYDMLAGMGSRIAPYSRTFGLYPQVAQVGTQRQHSQGWLVARNGICGDDNLRQKTSVRTHL